MIFREVVDPKTSHHEEKKLYLQEIWVLTKLIVVIIA